MSRYDIGSIKGQNVQIGDNNRMEVHPSVTRLEAELDRNREALDDPLSVDRARQQLSTELSGPAPAHDRLATLIGTIDANAASAPTVLQSLDEVRRMLGLNP